MLQNSVDAAKLGDKDKSAALKRLHKVAVAGRINRHAAGFPR